MWHRDAFFVSLCVIGLALTASRLFQGQYLEITHHEQDDVHSQQIQQVAGRVSNEFLSVWRKAKLKHAPLADNLTIARRLSLALTGTVPALEEIRSLQRIPKDRQLQWWTDRLLNDRRFSDYMAERLARAFVGTDGGPFVFYRRRRFVTWISEQLQEDVAYDELVRRVISDEGVWTTDPAVNFVTVTASENTKNQPDPIRLAGRTARAFLAMRIDCLQCHDDRLGNVQLGGKSQPRDGTQQDFHRLAAFFAATKTTILGIRDGEGEYQYRFLDKTDKEKVPPDAPFLNELLSNEGSQRERLARWVTHRQNRPFARATVNRVWAILFGTPLVDPVDNISLHGPFPAAMETLANDFIEHDYNLRRLIRIIVGSKPFRVDSRASNFEVSDEHEQNWSVFRLTRLRAEQVAGALIQSCSTKTIDADAHIFSKLARHFQEVEFVKRFGDLGENEFEDRGGTIGQRLLLMNGDLVKQLTKKDLVGNASTRIAMLAQNDQRAIETAYLCVLSRHPTKRESDHFLKRLSQSTGDNRSQLLEDLFWVLLNSTEFSWNH